MADYGAKYADKIIRKVDRQLQAEYHQAERELVKKLADFVRRSKATDAHKNKQLKAGIITEEEYQSWLKGQVFQKRQWESKIRSVQRILHEHNEQAAKIVHENKLDVYGENYLYQQYEMEMITGMSFDIYSEKAVSKLIRDRDKLLPEWKIDEEKDYKWNYNKVNNAVTQGIIQGESVEKIMHRLARDLSSQNESKMRMFARTAITGAQNAGHQRQMEDAEKNLGIKQYKQWITTLDMRTRDAHRHLDGQEVPYNKSFESDLGKIRFPGDPEAEPGNTYNCRCDMITIYPEYRDEQENWRKTEEINGLSYNAWKYEHDIKGVWPKNGSEVQSGGIEDPRSGAEDKSKEEFEIPREVKANVTSQDASEDWFEYENANMMSEYMRTGEMPKHNMNGQEVNDEMRQKLAAEAELMQETGQKTKTEYKTLYRGMVLDEETANEMFTQGEIYEFDTLTAATPEKKIARIYMDVENNGRDGVPVIIEIQKPDGIYGFKRDALETVLPKGSAFRVERKYKDSDGVIHISLYSKKGKNVTGTSKSTDKPKAKSSFMDLDLQKFAEKDLKKQRTSSLTKGIETLQGKIEIHLDKIKNPEKYVHDWDNRDEREKEGLKRHWEREIRNFEKGIIDRREEIKKRGSDDE